MMREFDVKKYKMLKNELKQRYLDEKLGKQQSYESQSNLFKPIIDTAKETSKDLQIVDDRTNLNNVLVPIANQLIQASNDRAAIGAMPFYDSDIQQERFFPQPVASSTPRKDISGVVIDLDKNLDEEDKKNLKDMNLPLPSEVIKQGNYDKVLKDIITLNKSHGVHLGIRSIKNEKEKEMYRSRREALEKYRESLKTQQNALKYKAGEGLKSKKKKLVKPKRGRGRPKTNHFISYSTPDELMQKLAEYMTAYKAGNNGVYNAIVESLDDLLKI